MLKKQKNTSGDVEVTGVISSNPQYKKLSDRQNSPKNADSLAINNSANSKLKNCTNSLMTFLFSSKPQVLNANVNKNSPKYKIISQREGVANSIVSLSSNEDPATRKRTSITHIQDDEMSDHGNKIITGFFSQISPKVPYDDLIEELKATKTQFTDPDFPPELHSLTGGLSKEELAENGNPLDYKTLIWLRMDDIYGKGEYKVFQEDIEPNDVKQGSLENTYFLSTVASIAEFPNRIKRLFVTDEPNEQGCYAVKICDIGVWRTIILDDYLPCSAETNKPVFCRGNGKEIWVQLLEKAWAKVYGSYARIEVGLMRECLHDLTGAPTKYILTDDPSRFDEIWEAIETGKKKNYIITCGSGDFFGQDVFGIIENSAYSLLAAIRVKDRDKKETKLLKLRNPWGMNEWTGDWSDESSTWTEELKKQVQLDQKDDGIFFMSYDDFLKYFTDIQICEIIDNYAYNSLRAISDSRHACFFELTVEESGHYHLTINQESKRKFAEKDNYQYRDVYLVLGKKVGTGYEYIAASQRADKEVWVESNLSQGKYIVYTKVAWNSRKYKEFSISSYGPNQVKINQVPKGYCGDFIEKVHMSVARQSKKFESYKQCGVTNCFRTYDLLEGAGFGYIYYRNDSKLTLFEELTFKIFEGVKLKKPYRGTNYKVAVPPGQEKIVIIKIFPNYDKPKIAFTEKSKFLEYDI